MYNVYSVQVETYQAIVFCECSATATLTTTVKKFACSLLSPKQVQILVFSAQVEGNLFFSPKLPESGVLLTQSRKCLCFELVLYALCLLPIVLKFFKSKHKNNIDIYASAYARTSKNWTLSEHIAKRVCAILRRCGSCSGHCRCCLVFFIVSGFVN